MNKSPRIAGSIENPDLQKMRRFALLMSVILMTYSLAAIQIDTSKSINLLGIPIKINNIDSIGYALIFATCYGIFRYFYYAMVVNLSPSRFRKTLMEEETESEETDYRYQLFEGEERMDVIYQLNEVFPTLGSKGVGIAEPETEEDMKYVEFKLPPFSKVLVILQDLDYSSPVWFGSIALIVSLC